MKLYCADMIMEIFYNKPLRKQVEILQDALSSMRAANWQTEADVLARAMGFEKFPDLRDAYCKPRKKLTPNPLTK